MIGRDRYSTRNSYGYSSGRDSLNRRFDAGSSSGVVQAFAILIGVCFMLFGGWAKVSACAFIGLAIILCSVLLGLTRNKDNANRSNSRFGSRYDSVYNEYDDRQYGRAFNSRAGRRQQYRDESTDYSRSSRVSQGIQKSAEKINDVIQITEEDLADDWDDSSPLPPLPKVILDTEPYRNDTESIKNNQVQSNVIKNTEELNNKGEYKANDAEELNRQKEVEVAQQKQRLDRALAYFKVPYKGSYYKLADSKYVINLLQQMRFVRFRSRVYDRFGVNLMKISQLFAEVKGFIIPRNYVKAAYVRNSDVITLVTISGQDLNLEFRQGLPIDAVEELFRDLKDVFPKMEVLDNPQQWLMQNKNRMIAQIVQEVNGIDYNPAYLLTDGLQ